VHAIETRQLVRKFGEFVAVDRVEFDVNRRLVAAGNVFRGQAADRLVELRCLKGRIYPDYKRLSHV